MLDAQEIQAGVTGWPGLTVHTVAAIDSTNLAAQRHLADWPLPFALIADSQSAGVGRAGHRFDSPQGAGLYLSLAFAPDPACPPALITPAAGVAACRAVAEVLGVRVQIKWVNDLLLGKRKVAGILATAVPDPLRVVLGVGLNLLPRPDIPLAATALPIGWLQASGAPDCRAALTTALLSELAALLAQPATIMPAYRQLAAWVGEPVVLTGAGSVHHGKVAGFADSGALLLDTPEGRLAAATGSIRRARP